MINDLPINGEVPEEVSIAIVGTDSLVALNVLAAPLVVAGGIDGGQAAPGGFFFYDGSYDCEIQHLYSNNFTACFDSLRDDGDNNCDPALRCFTDKTLRGVCMVGRQ